MRKTVSFGNYFRFFLLSIFVAFVLTMLIGLLFGYKYILVNGSSSAQEIPFQSFILTYKCKKSDVHVNDFAMTSLSNGRTYLTHQVIGIKYDGYFEPGECYSWEMNGETYHSYYGFHVNGENDVTAKSGGIPSEAVQNQEKANMTPDGNIKLDCDLITMANSQDGNTTKEYRTFETDFKGKVIWHNYTLGKTLFILRDPAWRNRLLLIGIIYCIVIVFVMSNQSKLHIGFYD